MLSRFSPNNGDRGDLPAEVVTGATVVASATVVGAVVVVVGAAVVSGQHALKISGWKPGHDALSAGPARIWQQKKYHAFRQICNLLKKAYG